VFYRGLQENEIIATESSTTGKSRELILIDYRFTVQKGDPGGRRRSHRDQPQTKTCNLIL